MRCLVTKMSWLGSSRSANSIERDAHLGADVGDEVSVEHERIARPAQRVERPALQGSEGFRHIAHTVDCTEGLSRWPAIDLVRSTRSITSGGP